MWCAVALLGGLAVLPALAQTGSLRQLSLEELRDRIRGGWAGQMIGVSYGAPTEFRYLERIIPKDELPAWTPEKIVNALNQDDLYVDMTFAQVLDDRGINATTEDFASMFRQAQYALWHANLSARRNLRRGVPARLAGRPDYNAHAEDIDFQIESDFIGLMAPGMPRAATAIAMRAGRVMNHGDGIYGGVFVSCMYSAAFFSQSPREVVEAGARCLPPQSKYSRVIADVLAWHKQFPKDWEAAWRRIEEKWNGPEPCPEGALRPFNIDAALNGAYIALGLLYGEGDMTRTIEVSTRAGQDSDCNPSNAAGILGVMLGYNRIPEMWKSGIPAIANQKFRYTNFTFDTIVESTLRRAIALASKRGGRQEGPDQLLVPIETPQPAPFEQWAYKGNPRERVAVTDPRWTFTGSWREDQETRHGRGRLSRVSDAKDATATFTFEGTGIVLAGPFLPTCGKAEVRLDSRKPRITDCYPDESAQKGSDAMWHAFGLKPGRHTLRVRVLGERIFDSQGANVALQEAIVFR